MFGTDEIRISVNVIAHNMLENTQRRYIAGLILMLHSSHKCIGYVNQLKNILLRNGE